MFTVYSILCFTSLLNASSNSFPDAFTTSAVPEGVTGFDHESRNDSVEGHTFKVSTPSMTDKVLNSQRRLLWEQPDVDVLEHCVNRCFVGEQ